MRTAALAIRKVWYAPVLAALLVGRARTVVAADVARWVSIVGDSGPGRSSTLGLIATYPEFRTLLYYRLRRASGLGAIVAAVLGIVYPGERTLHLACSDIGPGLFIQHGFATIVAARKVGANCWINQQVTIGFDRPEARPTIGDGVAVHAGAKVLGDIHVGDGARIGANAVVLEDVPAGHTAVGVKARLLPPKPDRT